MAKIKERTCICCGKVEETFSSVPYCAACFVKNKKIKSTLDEIDQINQWGYSCGEPTYNNLGKREYVVTRNECGHSFITTFGNLKTGINKNNGITPCGTCGKERRTKMLVEKNKKGIPQKAKASLIERNRQATVAATKRRKSKEFADRQSYYDLVWLLSNNEFRKSYYEINPQNLKRGNDNHLDHLVPIDYCFKNKIPAELCASKENLRMLGRADNIRKGASLNEEGNALISRWLAKTI